MRYKLWKRPYQKSARNFLGRVLKHGVILTIESRGIFVKRTLHVYAGVVNAEERVGGRDINGSNCSSLKRETCRDIPSKCTCEAMGAAIRDHARSMPDKHAPLPLPCLAAQTCETGSYQYSGANGNGEHNSSRCYRRMWSWSVAGDAGSKGRVGVGDMSLEPLLEWDRRELELGTSPPEFPVRESERVGT